MKCLIQQISLYGENILKGCSGGTVHSVYKKAVNLALGNRLISLQPLNAPMSPISLMTNCTEEEFGRLGIEKGERFFVTRDAIVIESKNHTAGEYLFLRLEASFIDLKLCGHLSYFRIKMLAENLELLLGEETIGGFRTLLISSEQTDTCLITVAARRRIRDALKAIRKSRWTEAAEGLCHLIGLGIGLTPSGDDFLCGLLAGMVLGNNMHHPFAEILRIRIASNIGRTNDLSRVFLECALEGQFGLATHSFYSAPADLILGEMRKVGHSSGIDTLCGVLYAFRLQAEMKQESKN